MLIGLSKNFVTPPNLDLVWSKKGPNLNLVLSRILGPLIFKLRKLLKGFTEKDYFFLDKIDINYIKNDIGLENISIKVGLNIYDSYEDRLTMVTPCMVKEFTIEGLIDKNFSANLWNICYGKIKEIVLNQNTQNLKEKLSLSDNCLYYIKIM